MMKGKNSLVLLLFILFATSTSIVHAQKKVDVVKFKWFEDIRKVDNDTTYVLNFWATWCMPCIAELPQFEKLHQAYQGQKVKVILVSLDFYKKLSITVIPFLEKKKIQSEVVLLDEPDYNKWIDKVDRKWEGSIPATLVFNNSLKKFRFIEGEVTYDDLENMINFK